MCLVTVAHINYMNIYVLYAFVSKEVHLGGLFCFGSSLIQICLLPIVYMQFQSDFFPMPL